MNNLQRKDTFTSLELVEQINHFRTLEENRNRLRHDTLLSIIRDEFEEEISLQKILESNYTNSRGRQYPMFILTASQAKQVLVRESKFVRRAVIKYIEQLENQLAAKSVDVSKLRYTVWANRRVMTTRDLSSFTGLAQEVIGNLVRKYNVAHVVLAGKALKEYKTMNRLMRDTASARMLLPLDSVLRFLKCVQLWHVSLVEKIKHYFRVEDIAPVKPITEELVSIRSEEILSAVDDMTDKLITAKVLLHELISLKRTKGDHKKFMEVIKNLLYGISSDAFTLDKKVL